MTEETNSNAGGVVLAATPSVAERLPLVCNAPDDLLAHNLRAAMQRKLPLVNFLEQNDKTALIVGGGPSLADDLDDIRQRKADGAVIFCLNNAAHYLVERGIVPDALIILDARAFNARFVIGLPKSITLYLAMQCAPETFDAAEGHETWAYHVPMGGISGMTEERQAAFICGGTSVGIRALHLVTVLGFREIHLYGYDSSYEGHEAHSYRQPENDQENVYTATVNGQDFHASAWMIRQADDFQYVAALLVKSGVSVHVHGRGLLPTIAQAMQDDTLHAIYDLARAPASWDFVAFLVHAEMERRACGLGKLEVSINAGPKDGFRDDPFPAPLYAKQALLEKVIRPLTEIAGASHGSREVGAAFPYIVEPIVRRYRDGEAVPTLSAPVWARDAVRKHLGGRHPIVVTLREAAYWQQRNTDMAVWKPFLKAQRGNLIIVRDTERAADPLDGFETFPAASLDVNWRLALYEEAALNVLTASGPLNLLAFSDAPYLAFNLSNSGYLSIENIEAMTGVKRTENRWPWAKPTQRIVWEQPTTEMLFAEFERLAPHLIAAQIAA